MIIVDYTSYNSFYYRLQVHWLQVHLCRVCVRRIRHVTSAPHAATLQDPAPC